MRNKRGCSARNQWGIREKGLESSGDREPRDDCL